MQTVTIVITFVLRYFFANFTSICIGAALGGITNKVNTLLKKMNKLKTQSEEESTSLMNAITSINDTLTDRLNSQLRKIDAAKTQSEEESTSLMNAITSINDTLTDRLNSQLRKIDAAKTQSEEESTSLMNAITSINDTLTCLKEDVDNLTTTQQQTGGSENPGASCRDILEQEPDSTSKYYWIRDPSGHVTQQYCDVQTGGSENPGASCRDILEQKPDSTSKYYWIRDSSGHVTQQYCDMEREGCGTRGGWMRVAHLDMTQPNQQCPSGFRLITSSSKRLCGRPGPAGCVSVKFSTNDISYNKVCGKVIAYQDGSTDSLCPRANSQTINEAYIDGVSITHGNPRQHIWSFVASLSATVGIYTEPCQICPCSPDFQGTVPPFMGNNYFCESGADTWVHETRYRLYPDNPLWDGEGCATSNSCCENNPPWFCTELTSTNSNDIELRLCGDEPIDNEDVPIEKFELYVQ